ncbi:twin-arginine translocation signal domain-containing protein [Cupriavidus sp. 2MCAB6]
MHHRARPYPRTTSRRQALQRCAVGVGTCTSPHRRPGQSRP